MDQNRHRRIFSVLSGSAFDGDTGFGGDAGGFCLAIHLLKNLNDETGRHCAQIEIE
jgi:hypothetical protein